MFVVRLIPAGTGMAYHEARKVKEKMDDEERLAIVEADAMSLAADQADQTDQVDASPSEAAE